ncbi:MAG: hypothetical protein HZC28_15100 [Spirochaetes bacterium]|nr:hypothetical protein [Spirochaetota bacterium]
MRNMKTLTALTLVLTLTVGTSLHPATSDSFDFLNIGMGGISASMGRASAADVKTIEGIYNNPASLGSLEGMTFAGAYNPYLSMSLWNVAGAVALAKGLNVAAAVYGLAYDDIIGDIQYNGDVGRKLPAGDMIASVSAAANLGALLGLPLNIDIGANGKYASETLDDLSLSGVMFDIGAIIRFDNVFGKDTLSFGATAKNIGVAFSSSPSELALPSTIVAGAAYDFAVGNSFSLKMLTDIEASLNSNPLRGAIGAEAGLFNLIFIRAGYLIGGDARGFTMGTGIHVTLGGMAARFDYAFIPLGDLGAQHNMQFGVSFGDNAPAAATAEKKAETARASAPEAATSDMSDEDLLKAGVEYAKNKDLEKAIKSWKKIGPDSEYYEKAQRNIKKANQKLREVEDDL